MVFLIVFPSFILKKAAFLIGFNSFLLLFSYSFYLFCSFLMHDGCGFSRTLAGLTIIPFLVLFINQLPIVYCFPVYHSPYIFMFFLNHFHSFLRKHSVTCVFVSLLFLPTFVSSLQS